MSWKHDSPTGGQSIPMFDYYMAPGVAKTFIKEIVKILDLLYDFDNLEELKQELYSYREDNKTIMDTRALKYITNLLKSKYSEDINAELIIQKAMKYTDKATYQSMEAVIANFNSMNSRAGR